MMFNSPSGLSDAMDLAKMLALLDLIVPLGDDDFRIWKQTRTGLLSYPLDPEAARGHLAHRAPPCGVALDEMGVHIQSTGVLARQAHGFDGPVD